MLLLGESQNYYGISPPTMHRRTFERIVISAYRWLAENYITGDRIFLFGEGLLATIIVISINEDTY